MNHDSFSLRMTGTYRARSAGSHLFSFGAAGRLRVTLDGQAVVDAWSGASLHMWPVELDEGQTIELTIEYGSIPGERWRWVGAGCVAPGPEVSIESAIAAAVDADVAIVVAGLNHEWESEGFDRPDLKLPGEQDDLIAAVASAQPNTVVVLTAGSAVEMPWADQVAAIVHAWYGGQEVGHAVADVLFGDSDPGGRLPLTFPRDSRQHPGLLNHPGEGGTVRYGEGVYVGYRGFDRLGLVPRFGFGHGLSYTTFEAGAAVASIAGDDVLVSVDLANTGGRAGTEVLQVFALAVGGVDRRLVGYQKVTLEPGNDQSVEVRVPLDRIRWWDPTAGGWKQPEGSVVLSVRGLFGEATCSVQVP